MMDTLFPASRQGFSSVEKALDLAAEAPTAPVEALRFLERLDPRATGFTFQTFDDHKTRKDPRLAKVIHGPIKAQARRLQELSAAGAGIFITINATDLKGRKEHNIKRIRAVFADLDGAPLDPVKACGLKPQMIVESSPGKYHAYWLVDELPLDQFKPVQDAIAARFSGDHVNDLPRVLRLPGYLHQKESPFVVRILALSEAAPYSAEQVLAEFPPVADGGHKTRARDLMDEEGFITPNGRHHSLVSMAGTLRAAGMTYKALLQALLAFNQEQCTPPKDDDEVDQIVRWVCQHERGEPDKLGLFEPIITDLEDLFGLNPASKKPSRGITGAQLMLKTFEPVRWVVPGILPEGLTLLIGAPKVGKSWLFLDWAVAVESGGEALGAVCEQGDVLYLALEDNERRLQGRLQAMKANPGRGVTFVPLGGWPRQGAGGIEALNEWLDDHPRARLIGIDTLARFRPRNEASNAYKADTEALTALHQLALQRRIAIVVVHHDRKAEVEDWLAAASGTLALGGTADSSLYLKRARGSQDAVLKGTGRDMEETEVPLRFDNDSHRWRKLDGPIAPTDQQEIIKLLMGAEELSSKEIERMIGRSQSSVAHLLGRMLRSGLIRRIGHGRWSLALEPFPG